MDKKSLLDITYPVRNGMIPDNDGGKSFEMLEKILEH